jgi:hypothetical protein
MPVPGSPLPLLSVPLIPADEQGIIVPVFVSVR